MITKNLSHEDFADFENPQIIWEVYGELLDFYDQHTFTAEQVAYETSINKKLINKVLHRLIQYNAVTCLGSNHWGTKKYKLNEAFRNV